MKRVRKFQVSTVGSGEGQASGRQSFESWHKAIDHAKKALSTFGGSGAGEIEITDPISKRLITQISTVDLQTAADAAVQARYSHLDPEDFPWSAPKWASVHFAEVDGVGFFMNRNCEAFHWQLLDGAVHESPFRLSFLERRAIRKPNGLVALCLGFVDEWRDMFVSQHARA